MSPDPAPSAPGNYLAAMRQAVAFTRELGYTHRTDFTPGPRLIDDAFAEVLREWARIHVASRPDDAIAGMCMQIAGSLVGFLAGAGIDAIYTLGWMSYGGHPVYQFGPRDVEHWLARGMPDRRRIDVHAWVTLPSGEIIDASWLTTVGIVQNRRELIGAVILTDPDQTTSHQYHPVTVDTPLLFRLDLLHLGTTDAPSHVNPSLAPAT